ncbi:hypothetical protein B566_EDAN018296 [Ephemera danica]|nr:hypothetical protein B566_EDAN018296 [Ephemera danica]
MSTFICIEEDNTEPAMSHQQDSPYRCWDDWGSDITSVSEASARRAGIHSSLETDNLHSVPRQRSSLTITRQVAMVDIALAPPSQPPSVYNSVLEDCDRVSLPSVGSLLDKPGLSPARSLESVQSMEVDHEIQPTQSTPFANTDPYVHYSLGGIDANYTQNMGSQVPQSSGNPPNNPFRLRDSRFRHFLYQAPVLNDNSSESLEARYRRLTTVDEQRQDYNAPIDIKQESVETTVKQSEFAEGLNGSKHLNVTREFCHVPRNIVVSHRHSDTGTPVDLTRFHDNQAHSSFRRSDTVRPMQFSTQQLSTGHVFKHPPPPSYPTPSVPPVSPPLMTHRMQYSSAADISQLGIGTSQRGGHNWSQTNQPPPTIDSQAAPLFSILDKLVESQKLLASKNQAVVLSDLKSAVATFSGETTTAEATAWLKSVNHAARSLNWPTEYKLDYCSQRLTGAAKHWYQRVNADYTITDWTTFEAAFIRTYCTGDSKTALYDEMKAYTQARDESLSVYFHKKSKLCAMAGLDFSDAKSAIINGLCNQNLALMLPGTEHDTYEQLYDAIRKFEQMDSTRRSQALSVEVNGHWLRGLIDSGATCCLIRQSAAIVCQLQQVKSDALLVGFGSDRTPTPAQGACTASISVDGTTAEVCIYIVADMSLTHDIIVGETFLGQQHVAMIKLGDRFVEKPNLTKSDVKIDESASNEDVENLLDLLNKYRDLFADSLAEVGCTNFTEMVIEELPNIHRFHGLASFFRRFVPRFASRAEQLSRLLKPQVKFEWSSEQQKSFEDIKVAISETQALKLYDPHAKTELHTDACAIGLAAMLLQEGPDGKMHLVYCASKRTTLAEEYYHSSKLELAAIVWALTRLRQFLLGISFTVYTDCEALIYLNAKKTINPQVARWFALTQEYDMDVKHRPGIRMAHVDALSRAPVENANETIDDMVSEKLDVRLALTLEEQILTMQRSDPELKAQFDLLAIPEKDRSREEKNMVKDFVLKNGIIYRNMDSRYLFFVPTAMRKSLVVRAHDLSGHFSVERTVTKLQENYWFPGLRRYVKHHVSHCFECIANKVPSGKRPGLLHPIPPGQRPFETVHLDHLGPFVTSSRGNKFLLIAADSLTKYVRLYATKDTSSRYVTMSLNDFIYRHGIPERCITDRGTAFTAQAFEEYCHKHGITHILIATRHPRANGQVERVNRTILPVIASAMTSSNHRDWDRHLLACENSLNCAVNASTKKSPFELLHGYRPRFHDGMFAVIMASTLTTMNGVTRASSKLKLAERSWILR